jgi:hypothetical protein
MWTFFRTCKWAIWELLFFRIVGGGVQTRSTRHRGHLLSNCACPGWLWGWRIIRWNEDCQGKPKYSEKTCPSATLSTTNPTWPDPGSNPGRRGGRPATNRLSYGAALYESYFSLQNTFYINCIIHPSMGTALLQDNRHRCKSRCINGKI